MKSPLGVAVVGCGLIGRRRALAAATHPQSRCVAVTDIVTAAAKEVATAAHAEVVAKWQEVLERDDVDVVIAATPNKFLAEIAIGALAHGKHVLVEKPMGRNLAEGKRMRAAALGTDRLLKIGFNHRYHPAIRRAHELFVQGLVGPLVSIRARYGHGSRPGCEKEWRASPEMAGGGELTDQGVHVADLVQWFAGVPSDVVGFVQTAVWPIEPLEDNAYGLYRFSSGAVAMFHVSMTQWKNLFSFEVAGELGALSVEGLGGSYGTERLLISRRRMAGGAPDVDEEVFAGPDVSWTEEWHDFVGAIVSGNSYWGTPDDGIAAMRMVDAVYRSTVCGNVIRLRA
ncbi:MAG: Gfo/Idh/MocA family protein [Gemmatimonadaceae bacterium]